MGRVMNYIGKNYPFYGVDVHTFPPMFNKNKLEVSLRQLTQVSIQLDLDLFFIFLNLLLECWDYISVYGLVFNICLVRVNL